jgi:hypothetical protein
MAFLIAKVAYQKIFIKVLTVDQDQKINQAVLEKT